MYSVVEEIRRINAVEFGRARTRVSEVPPGKNACTRARPSRARRHRAAAAATPPARRSRPHARACRARTRRGRARASAGATSHGADSGMDAAAVPAGFALAVLVAATTYILMWWNRNVYDLYRIPSPPGSWLWGHLGAMAAPDYHRALTRWAETYGAIYRIRILGLPGVIVSDPLAAGQLLGHDRKTPDVPKHVQVAPLARAAQTGTGAGKGLSPGTSLHPAITRASSPGGCTAMSRTSWFEL